MVSRHHKKKKVKKKLLAFKSSPQYGQSNLNKKIEMQTKYRHSMKDHTILILNHHDLKSYILGILQLSNWSCLAILVDGDFEPQSYMVIHAVVVFSLSFVFFI